MENIEFKAGDRVVSRVFGEGTIMEVTGKWGHPHYYAVVFDNYDFVLHDLEGRCSKGHGGYCTDISLKKIREKSWTKEEFIKCCEEYED